MELDPENSFKGKSILITGGAEGIGLGLGAYYYNKGANVSIIDINQAKLQKAKEQIEAYGNGVLYPKCFDCSNFTLMKAAIKEFYEKTHSLDTVILNAGITNYGGFLGYSEADFDKVMNLNVRSSYFSAQYAAQLMIEKKVKGRIILLGSITGVQAFPNLGAYGISKAAIIHMTKSIALELGKYGITCNTVSPGPTVTPRTLENDPNFEANWASVSMTPNVTQVVDIVNTVAFLTSEVARQITGQNIIVDGGWTMTSPIPDDHPEEPEYEYEK